MTSQSDSQGGAQFAPDTYQVTMGSVPPSQARSQVGQVTPGRA